MDALLKIEAVTSDNLKALRHLYDLVEAQVRGLKALGVTSDSYGSLLSSVLLSKIPREIRLIISRKVGGGDWDLDQLLKMLQEEVQARERASSSDNTPVKGRDRERSGKEPPTNAALFGGSGSMPTCYYCGQQHLAQACKNVQSVDERKRILREAGRCYMCLRRGHRVKQCSSKGRCPHCSGRHHGSICSPKINPEDKSKEPGGGSALAAKSKESGGGSTSAATHLTVGLNPEAEPFKPPTSTALWTNGNHAVLLQTAQAKVCNPEDKQHWRNIRIVLDSGSQRSYVTNKVREGLGLCTVRTQAMAITTFGSKGGQECQCDVVRIAVHTSDGGLVDLHIYVVPWICEPLACQPIDFCQANFSHLAGLPLADCSNGNDRLEVDMLIGSDLYWDLLTGKTCHGEGGPVAVETRLGWVLSGPVEPCLQGQAETTLMTTHTLQVESLLGPEARALDERLQTFWNLESIGIVGHDCSVLDEFRDKVRFVEGRYEVSLPWKDPHQVLPDNQQLSLRRLHSLLQRLKQDPEVFAEYDAIIKNQLQQGIVEIVEPSGRTGERVHYLPHHAVVRRDKETTKLRVVYDASAKSSGPSLNECLNTGPKFDQRILDLLLRFRSHRVALIADIEKAFLMIAVAEHDRDVLRFLWIDDMQKDTPDVLTFRFARVVFGVSASPFLLNATLQTHLEGYAPSDMVQKLLRSFYVDNLVTGADDEQEAYALFRESRDILKQGGFNLRKFRSNSSMLQLRIDGQPSSDQPTAPEFEADETYACATLGSTIEQQCGESKVLGVRWNVDTDQIVMSLEDIAASAIELEPTKRSIVSLVGRIYDPLGLLSPIVVQFKIFLQELCEAKLGWDEPLPDDLLRKWGRMSRSLCEGRQIFSIPRCFKDNQVISEYELCGFCDSSLKAYAAVVYLRARTPSGYQVVLVASKTLVAPLKQQTIPRLELLSALLLARLMSSVTQALQSEINFSNFHCFTDSTVALHWIVGVGKSWKPFVHNRVTEIRSLFPPSCWSHCLGRVNPADPASRGLTPQELASSQLWPCGPVWLQNEFDRVPDSQMPDECLVEVKANVAHGLLASVDAPSIARLM